MEHLNNGLSRHILPTAANMVGVCLTAVGLVKVMETRTGNSLFDDYFAIMSALFAVSVVLSYLSMRHTLKSRAIAERYERWADMVFITGIVGTALLALAFAYEIL